MNSSGKKKQLRSTSKITLATLLVAVSGCATTSTIEETPVIAELAPMEKPVYSANERIYEFDHLKKEERYYEITKVNDDGTYSGKNNNDCSWEDYGDLVSPAISWNNCNKDPKWHSGQNMDIKKKGNIWPLKVGNKASYTFTQVDASGQKHGRTTRKCQVTETVNIDVAAVNVDAFKVVCKRTRQNWRQTRVYYFSPGFKTALKFTRSSTSEGIQSDNEFIRIEDI